MFQALKFVYESCCFTTGFMFSYIANRCLGWRKSTCCKPARFPLQSLLDDFVSSTDDIYGHDDVNGNVPPLACCFCKSSNSSNILAASDENGFVTIFNTRFSGKKSILKNWNAHGNAVFDLAWVGNTENLLTASGDQTIILWNTPSMERIQCFKGHSKSVKSISVKPDNPSVFCSGSRDGQILIYDMRVNSRDGYTSSMNAIKNAHTMAPTSTPYRKSRAHLTWRHSSTRNFLTLDRHKSVTSVLFHSDHLLVSAGAINNDIKVWDLRKSNSFQHNPIPVYTFSPQKDSVRNHGITSLVFDSSSTKLFASCKDSKIYQYDFASCSSCPVKIFHGFENASFYIKSSISPCDQYLISGSHDNAAYIWDIENSETGYPYTLLTGHTAEVTSVIWSPHEFDKIVSLSDDNTLRLWRIQRDDKPTKDPNWGTATKYDIPFWAGLETSSPCLTFLSDEKSTPETPDQPQKPPSPVSLDAWLKSSGNHKNNAHSRTDSTPIGDTPENSKASASNKNSQVKLNVSINGKPKVLAKRNLETAYDELQPCTSSSKRCNILQSPNRGDEKLAIKLDDVDTEGKQTDILKWLDVVHDHGISDMESKSQVENLSPCQTRVKHNRLSEVHFEETSSSSNADATLKKTIVQSLLPLSAILKTPSPKHSKQRRSATKRYHPITPNSSRKTPHKSSPVVMSGKQSILSYLHTNGSPNV